MSHFLKTLSQMVIFHEPKKNKSFVLSETDKERVQPQETEKEEPRKVERKIKNEDLLLDKRNIKSTIQQQTEGKNNQKEASENSDELSKEVIKPTLDANLKYMKEIYSIPQNSDLVLREFSVVVKEKVLNAFVIYFDGMADRTVINDNILQPLMLLSNLDIKSGQDSISEYVSNHLLPQGQIKTCKYFVDVIDEINFGGIGVFIDNMNIAFAADVKGWEHRGVGRPNTEMVIRGPQEGFTEVLRINTALIRKIIKNENLIAENINIGRLSKTPCSLMYLKDIANPSIVDEVRRRLQNIKLDYIIDSGELEQLIEDSSFLPSPQIIDTERPDKVAANLSEGKIAVILNGSPFALIMPVTITAFIHSPEDSYIRFPYANFLRAIRILGILFTLLLPGFFIAITNYHQEMIPTELLLAIQTSRSQVPFPSVIELLVMEIAFELIREAGVRIPGPIGPTLGIIGALILGQAAVAANIVSPILIIVVAVTGIGSFAIPNFSLAMAFRILRFVYIFLGAIAGFFGIALGIFIHSLLLIDAKSFGVPFMAPFAPKLSYASNDEVLRSPMWKQEKRPDVMNPMKVRKQPKISRKWLENDKKGDEHDGRE